MKVQIKQVKSGIGHKANQKATLVALGLRRINHTVEKEFTDQIKGMVRTVSHLVEVKEL
jgi:large subunit ribosomal protein L30